MDGICYLEEERLNICSEAYTKYSEKIYKDFLYVKITFPRGTMDSPVTNRQPADNKLNLCSETVPLQVPRNERASTSH